jgi:hypothetical protein
MRLVLAFLAAIGFAGIAAADEHMPVELPQATGDPHPEGNDYWRIHHMDMLLHDRDLTMRDGVRNAVPGEEPIQASLGACFDCHAAKDEAGTEVSYDDERHFCRVCHDYAAVQVDCFMCHRSTSSDTVAFRAMAQPDDPLSIEAYLARVSEGTTQ